jgi:hypothetical protein
MVNQLRALTVRQPWASLLMCQPPYRKRYEVRTWPTQYRGPLAIHAAAAPDPEIRDLFPIFRQELQDAGYIAAAELPLAAHLGLVDLVNCVPAVDVMVDEYEAAFIGDADYCYLFDTANPRLLHTPVAARGALSLWIPTPAEAVELAKLL